MCAAGLQIQLQIQLQIRICAGLWIVECVGEKLQGHNVLPKGKEEEEEAKR